MFFLFIWASLQTTITIDGNAVEVQFTSDYVVIGDNFSSAISQYKIIDLDLTSPIAMPDKNYEIRKIANQAFALCSISSIKFPKSLEEIGTQAFASCNCLETIDLSNTRVKSVPKYMAYDCPKLRKIIFSETVEQIEEFAFSRTHITELDLTNIKRFDITSILNCSELTSFALNKDSLFSFSENALFSKDKLSLLYTRPMSHSYIIPQNVKRVGPYAFYNSEVENVVIPETVTTIGKSAFACTSKLFMVVIKGQNLEDIGDSAFEYSSIQNISLPASVLFINQSAFKQTQIKSISLFDCIALCVPKKCFYQCKDLCSVLLPKRTEIIGASAFSGCNLKNIFFPLDLEIIDRGAFAYNPLQLVDMHPTNIKKLSRHAFRKCYQLTVVVLPWKLTTFNEACFEDDYKITLVIYCGKNKIMGHKFYTDPDVVVSTFYPDIYFADRKVVKRSICPYPLPVIVDEENGTIISDVENIDDYTKISNSTDSKPRKIIDKKKVPKKTKSPELLNNQTSGKMSFLSFMGSVIMVMAFFYALHYL